MLSIRMSISHYGAAQALRGVSIEAESGKVTCVLGRNGVGKTVAAAAMIGHQPIRRARSRWAARRSFPARRMQTGRAGGSPMCRRAARSFRC
jgi:urea transport system ATP-binding protein